MLLQSGWLKATALRSAPLSRNPPFVKSQILATRREKRENRAHTRQSESEPQTSVLLTSAKSCDIFATVSRVAAILAVQQPSHRPRCQPRKRGIRPVGGKPALILPNISRASSPSGGSVSSTATQILRQSVWTWVQVLALIKGKAGRRNESQRLEKNRNYSIGCLGSRRFRKNLPVLRC
jgi:hypothetical protein